MTNNYQILPDTTRVWVYQSNRPFPKNAIQEVKAKIKAFVNSWASHGSHLNAFGDLLHQQFIVLMVDESQAGASGCSIDSSVYFLKSLQGEYNVDLFDRMTFTYLEGDEVKTVPRMVFGELYRDGKITDQTLVFDTLVNNKGDFEKKWVKPLGQSWHKRMV